MAKGLKSVPSPAMMKPVKNILRFMETFNVSSLDAAFASRDVILVDSFAPYTFRGQGAASRWAKGFMKHAANIKLRHSLGKPQEFSRQGDTVFFSQPVTWQGSSGKGSFSETGGLALVLVKQGDEWRVRNYGWAVTKYTQKKSMSR